MRIASIGYGEAAYGAGAGTGAIPPMPGESAPPREAPRSAGRAVFREHPPVVVESPVDEVYDRGEEDRGRRDEQPAIDSEQDRDISVDRFRQKGRLDRPYRQGVDEDPQRHPEEGEDRLLLALADPRGHRAGAVPEDTHPRPEDQPPD